MIITSFITCFPCLATLSIRSAVHTAVHSVNEADEIVDMSHLYLFIDGALCGRRR